VDDQTVSLKPVNFAEIEGWTADDHAAAFAALQKSCRKKFAGNSACKEALALGEKVSGQTARRFFETHHVPHRFEGVRPGLVTGYYEPEVNGSRERSGGFQVPSIDGRTIWLR
jgi:membrane-bound lytic murein transglycosylase A